MNICMSTSIHKNKMRHDIEFVNMFSDVLYSQLLVRSIIKHENLIFSNQKSQKTNYSVTFAPVVERDVGIGRRFRLPGARDFFRCLGNGASILYYIAVKLRRLPKRHPADEFF